eukprot:6309274-Amphidinium_carterae.1
MSWCGVDDGLFQRGWACADDVEGIVLGSGAELNFEWGQRCKVRGRSGANGLRSLVTFPRRLVPLEMNFL